MLAARCRMLSIDPQSLRDLNAPSGRPQPAEWANRPSPKIPLVQTPWEPPFELRHHPSVRHSVAAGSGCGELPGSSLQGEGQASEAMQEASVQEIAVASSTEVRRSQLVRGLLLGVGACAAGQREENAGATGLISLPPAKLTNEYFLVRAGEAGHK